jgi:hypothetical protein
LTVGVGLSLVVRSNEDWGWKFTATAEFKKQTVVEELHWLIQLDKQLGACGAGLSKVRTLHCITLR